MGAIASISNPKAISDRTYVDLVLVAWKLDYISTSRHSNNCIASSSESSESTSDSARNAFLALKLFFRGALLPCFAFLAFVTS